MSGPTLRPLTPADQAVLWELLHVALWDPPPAGLRPREVLDHPGVRIYAEDWGRAGDIGVAAEVDGRVVGACWMRVVPDGKGLAWVDDTTPQLGIGIFPAWQRRGLGEKLMRAALAAAKAAGVAQVSLTVHPENPAIALYRRCGFSRVPRDMAYHLMTVPLR